MTEKKWQALLGTAEHERVVRLRQFGNSQALTLPRGFRIEKVDQARLYRIGNRVVVEPYRLSWDSYQYEGGVENDFLPQIKAQAP